MLCAYTSRDMTYSGGCPRETATFGAGTAHKAAVRGVVEAAGTHPQTPHWAWHSGTPWGTQHSRILLVSSIAHVLIHLSVFVAHPPAPPHAQPLWPSMLPVADALPGSSAFLVYRARAARLMTVLRPRRLSRSPHRLLHIRRSPVPTLPPSLAHLLRHTILLLRLAHVHTHTGWMAIARTIRT